MAPAQINIAFFSQGPGFGSCPTSTCDAYIDPNAEGNVPGSFPMVPGQTLDPFTKLPGQTLDPFIANGSMGGEGELVELGNCDHTSQTSMIFPHSIFFCKEATFLT